MSDTDDLFDAAGGWSGRFRFDERVVRVFPDMIHRSVPGYELLIPLAGMLARRYAQDGSMLFDLGCSLGATTLAMRQAVRASIGGIVAVDSSPSMVHRARELISRDPGEVPVEVREEDIRCTEIVNASVVALNFTLQFVEPGERLDLLERIGSGLLDGGVLILSEKIRFPDALSQSLQDQWHHDFKQAKGYSNLAIAGKRAALEQVLRADAETVHIERLHQAGFKKVERWFQCFSFCSYLAMK